MDPQLAAEMEMAQNKTAEVEVALEKENYVVGDRVAGHVQLTVTEATAAEKVDVMLKCRGKTHVTTSGPLREVHGGSEEFEAFHPVVVTIAVFPSGAAEEGVYHFPFAFQLPDDAVPSLFTDRGKTSAKLEYIICGILRRPGVRARDLRRLFVFNVLKRRPLDLDPKSPLLPFERHEAAVLSSGCFSSSKGAVHIEGSISNKAFETGEELEGVLNIRTALSGLAVKMYLIEERRIRANKEMAVGEVVHGETHKKDVPEGAATDEGGRLAFHLRFRADTPDFASTLITMTHFVEFVFRKGDKPVLSFRVQVVSYGRCKDVGPLYALVAEDKDFQPLIPFIPDAEVAAKSEEFVSDFDVPVAQVATNF